MSAEKFTFFWKGPFSQWYPSVFFVNETKYYCAEMWMMSQKALLFNDMKTFNDIMSTVRPKEHQLLGRTVKNFDQEIWDAKAIEIVFEGNLNKYQQNPLLKGLLFDTVGTTLVEASPYDKIWGIGLPEDHPHALRRDLWLGKNWLGETLTKVRDYLLTLEEDQHE